MKKLVEEQVAAIHAYQVPEQSGKKQEVYGRILKKSLCPVNPKMNLSDSYYYLCSVLAILAYSYCAFLKTQ